MVHKGKTPRLFKHCQEAWRVLMKVVYFYQFWERDSQKNSNVFNDKENYGLVKVFCYSIVLYSLSPFRNGTKMDYFNFGASEALPRG